MIKRYPKELEESMLKSLRNLTRELNAHGTGLSYAALQGHILFSIGCSDFSHLSIQAVTDCWLIVWDQFLFTPEYRRNIDVRSEALFNE